MTRTKLTLAVALALSAAAVGTTAFAHGMDGRPMGDRAARMGERFAEMDTDKDGKVSAAEMRAYHAARFAKADQNGDGTLTVEELDAAGKAQRVERLQKMVTWLDTDGDGVLSVTEYDPHRGMMMSRMDEDGDGTLTMEEMRDAGKQFHHGREGREMGRPGQHKN